MNEIIQQVQKRMLISLAQVAKNLDIHEGDHVLIEEKDGGIFIKPVSWHDKSQEYFWSEEWQNKMKRSKEDLEKGNFKTCNTVEGLLNELGEEENADSTDN